MAKTIRITLDLETQQLTADLDGFHGIGCAAITKAVEELGDVQESHHKPAYNEKVCNVVQRAQ